MRSPPIRIETYRHADNIVRSYNERNELLLRDIVASAVSDSGYVDSLDFWELLHQARIVRGVAEKILKGRNQANKTEQARTPDTSRSLEPIAGSCRQLLLF